MKDFRKKLISFAKDKNPGNQWNPKNQLLTGYISEEMHRKLRDTNKKKNPWQ